MNKLNEETLDHIIDSATELFLRKSIKDVTISEIAKAAKVGEASLYRYFKTKQTICVSVATKLAKKVYEEFFSFQQNQSGFDLLTDFYCTYLKIFRAKKEYYSFVKELDAYVLLDSDVVREDYENQIDFFFDLFSKFYQRGIEDGTVLEVQNLKLLYYTTTHSILNLCKSLATEAYLVSQDNATLPEEEIEMLIHIILSFLKKGE